MNGVDRSRGQASVRAMQIGRGMFTLRYAATALPGVPLRVLVAPDPDEADQVEMLFSPGAAGGVLRQPGDLCVLSAQSEATILITTLGEQGKNLGRADAVRLELNRLDQAAPQPRASAPLPALSAPVPQSASASERLIPLRIAGHIERQGDVFVSAGEWLGDPNGSARLEGFSLQWPRRPGDVDVAYGCAVGGLGRMPDVVAGEFVGTRGQGRGINGISLNLIGDAADAYALIVEAAFSDGTYFGPALAPVDLMGPTGREHLVALRLQLSEMGARAQKPAGARGLNGAGPAKAEPRKPARIFRAAR
ncbi:hypothetical protein [Methylobacterium nigriterrae]|uniref:hypothetical protein n=1 Tax=Methylobacterium nigriterrae TaxID=3127512 RepID=UPI00301384BD